MSSTFAKIVSILFCNIFLVSCSNLAKSEEIQGSLTVLTAEFQSGTPVNNLLISLEDVVNDQEIDSEITTIDGVAFFNGLEEGKTYRITATSLDNIASKKYSSIEEFTFKSTSPNYVIRTHSSNNQRIAVPQVMQNPELPNGCEITSLTSVFNYYGLKLSKTEMSDSYLPQQNFRIEGGKKYGANPNKAYTGSPYQKRNGTYVFAAPIVEAAKRVINDNDLSLQATDMSGQSTESILKLIEQGVPVIVWVTLDLSKPRKNGGWIIDGTNIFHEMYQNLHSVVLIGQTAGEVIVMDPLKGYVTHNKQEFFNSYVELGEYAVAVHK